MSRARQWALCLSGYALLFGAFFGAVPLRGDMLASGDALVESVPACLGPQPLWTSGLFLGYPLAADPNQLHWYPLNVLCGLGAYDLLAAIPFFIAAVGATGLVLAITRSWCGAVSAGLVYSLGGFMIAHAGHLMIVHPAAWAPFVLWAFEELREPGKRGWLVAGAAAVALCLLGGQPQIPVFAFTLAAAYALAGARSAPSGPLPYLRDCAAALVLGVGLAAPLLVPEFELFASSTRRSLSDDVFSGDALSPAEVLVRLVFPYFLGGSMQPLYPLSVGTIGPFTEHALSPGFALFVPAALGLAAPRAWRAMFWAFVCVAGCVLATGPALGTTIVTYHLPLYSLFREPGRHGFEAGLALAVLAGFGVARLALGMRSRRTTLAALAAAGVVGCAAWAAAAAGFGGALSDLAQSDGADVASLLNPFSNSAIGIPLLSALVVAAAVVVAAMRRKAAIAVAAALGASVLIFAWGGYWNWQAASRDAAARPDLASQTASALGDSRQRALWTPGTRDGNGLPPNLSLLWGVPTASGYAPLVFDSVQRLLGLEGPGSLSAATVTSGNALDVAATRFVLLRDEDLATQRPASAPFEPLDRPTFLGGRGATPINQTRFGSAAPLVADRIGLVSAIGFGAEIPQGTQVAEIRVTTASGRTLRFPLRAGIETAEAALDRPDVAPHLRHRAAETYSNAGGYRTYAAFFPVSPPDRIAAVTVRRTYPDPQNGALTVNAVSLVDSRTGKALALGALSALAATPGHWRRHDIGTAIGFENLKAVPRAWVPRSVRAASDDVALAAIHDERNTGAFDARRDAFVEDPSAAAGADGTAHVDRAADDRMDVTVTCRKRCLVVTSDAWYPGWQATVDGRQTPVVVADVALRGALVPAGSHALAFRYAPASATLGVGIGVLSALALAALYVRGRRSTASIEIDPPSKPETGKVTASSG